MSITKFDFADVKSSQEDYYSPCPDSKDYNFPPVGIPLDLYSREQLQSSLHSLHQASQQQPQTNSFSQNANSFSVNQLLDLEALPQPYCNMLANNLHSPVIAAGRDNNNSKTSPPAENGTVNSHYPSQAEKKTSPLHTLAGAYTSLSYP